MEECPYCGAQNEVEAVQCATCMAVLREVDEDTMADIEKKAERDAAAARKDLRCPRCDASNSPKNRRCTACGTQLEAPVEVEDQSAVKYGIWAVFGGVGFMALLVLTLAIYITTDTTEERIYVSANPAAMAQKYAPAMIKNRLGKLQEEWKQRYEGKYVKWTGQVVEASGYTVTFALSPEAKKSKTAEAQVNFDSLPDGVEAGKEVEFDAKFEAFDQEGFRFVLVNGMPVE